MTDKECESLRTLISEREELSYKRLNNNSCYLEIRERQRHTEEIVEKMYHERFTHEERITIRRHYEGETEKSGMEVHEAYVQGLRDCFRLVIRLGLLTD